jgi:plasmid replication initiation protein
LLSSIERTDDDYYEFELNNHIINSLKNQTFFAPLDLMIINSLASQYSIIFYELAIQYKKYKIPKMKTEEVRRITNTQDIYKQFYDFRKRVLDIACEEISEKTDIILTYKTEKIGRRIAFIDFEIEKKEIPIKLETKVEEPEKYSAETLDLFELLPKGEQVESNKRELAKLLAGHTFRYLKADIDYTKKAQPDNFMGFLKASCQSGHYSSAELEKEEMKKELSKKREEG